MKKKIIDTITLKFIMVGILNTIVGEGIKFLMYYICDTAHLLHPDTNYYLSAAVGYIIGSVVSFFLNKYFTFRSKSKSVNEVLKFILNIVVCWVIAYCGAKPLTELLLPHILPSLSDYTNYIAMIAGAGIFFVLNYLSQRFFVFKK